ncbi:MAG: HAD family hydrolase [Pseudomonadota bacterium]
MWSGPRNISTALMRAFEARGDTAVVDEPFYACYLAATGLDHPLRQAVLESQPRDAADVVRQLRAPLPAGCAVQYQKQMAHHLVFEPDERWLAELSHAFLIREPAAMVASYARKRETVAAGDLGLGRQRQLYRQVTQLTGRRAPVIDARDVLTGPPALLAALCANLGIPYTDDMCRWPPGLRASDGVWASHWYDAVARSSGFAPYRPQTLELDPAQQAVADQCEDDYRYLHERRLRA